MATALQIAQLRLWLETLADAAGVTSSDAILVTRALAKAFKGNEANAARAVLDAARIVGEAGDPAVTAAAVSAPPQTGDDTLDRAGMVVAIVVSVYGTVRTDYRSSNEASAARHRLTEAVAPAYAAIGEAFGADVLDLVASLVGTANTELTATAANRAPIVTAQSAISLPASLMAWELYQDPGRGGELAERNAVGTPHFMPVTFEALGR